MVGGKFRKLVEHADASGISVSVWERISAGRQAEIFFKGRAFSGKNLMFEPLKEFFLMKLRLRRGERKRKEKKKEKRRRKRRTKKEGRKKERRR